MILEEGMVVSGYVSRIVNNDNVRYPGYYYIESISDNTILKPVKKDGDFWVPDGKTVVIGENTNTLGEWEYVTFVETVYMPNISKTPVSTKANPLEGMSKEEILSWIKENM